MSQDRVNIVGGGLGGLVAAITCAELGHPARLIEASGKLGGRARTTSGDYAANFGPHALYKGRSNWKWLAERDLLPKTATPSATGVRYRYRGKIRRTQPAALVRAITVLGRKAPVDRDFRSWITSRSGEKVAGIFCAWAGPLTFHPDPGALSAAFVWERFRWIYMPPSIRHVVGGWGVLVDRLEARARELGVEIETGTRLQGLPEAPVILATELGDAGDLLGEPGLHADGADAVLLDVGIEARRGDPVAVLDLDGGVLVECFAGVAPEGHRLIQAHLGLQPGADADEAAGRIEEVIDAAYKGWRERTVWRRRQLSARRSGAVDLPGHTWEDRPAIDRGAGRFLVGDMVAAPGLLSEVSFNSAITAAGLACEWIAADRAPAGSVSTA